MWCVPAARLALQGHATEATPTDAGHLALHAADVTCEVDSAS